MATLVTVVGIGTPPGKDRPPLNRETFSSNRIQLLEAAQARTQGDLTKLRQRVDDHHADATGRFDQLHSELQRAIGRNDRRARALAQSQQEILEHLALFTSKVAEHDDRFDKIEVRLDNVDNRLDKIDLRLDNVDTRLDGVDARLESVDSKLDEVLRRLA